MNKDNNKDRLLRAGKAASILGVSTPTLLRWHRSGVLHGVKIGEEIRYYESDIRAILEGKQM